ncbi:molybdenum cofactor sulfurase-like [Salvia divinorum]|uniref:Molybdenum cofactor sulfurase-like n=1 Tax=Salvia divinorum TaxID=28513 RepID=A0ABD1HF24_SALDI
MHSPRLKEATQVCFQGCCPNPVMRGRLPEAEQPITKASSTLAVCRRNFAATTASSLFPATNFTNHESIPSLQESFVQFIKAYPKYSDTAPVDQIRAREYGHLELSNHVSLDYIGVGLFSQSQVMSRYRSAISAPSSSDFPLFGISFKSVSLKSQLLHGGEGSELESAIKKRIMDFLNISQNDYAMVFTVNRSAAFKLVAESYPYQSSRKLLTVYDHESEALSSMISTSGKRGARVMAAEFKWPRLRIHSAKLRKMVMRKKKKKKQRGLFLFPLQSRMTGASYSYQWMTLAQEHGWHVLLDACALGPKDMDSFGLSLFRPDFLICSFYKVFGEDPTGFGCLFVKKSVVPMLEASAGAGIVSITPAKNDSSGTDTELEQMAKLGIKEEAGNVGIASLECRCLDHVDSLGLTVISSRSRYLINWVVTAVMKLKHPNRLDSFPLVTIYGPKGKFERAPALAFNISDWKGEMVEPALVQKLADRNHISIGIGMLHHVWFADKEEEEKHKFFERAKNNADHKINVVTTALTFLANFEDVYRLWAFIAQFLDADFVEKERWRYTALNQKTIEV